MPGARSTIVNPGGGDRQRAASAKSDPKQPAPPPEVDVMAMFRRMFASGQAPMPQFGPPTDGQARRSPHRAHRIRECRAARSPECRPVPRRRPAEARDRSISRRSSSAGRDRWCRRATSRRGRWRRRRSGYVPGAPIISTPMLGEGLSRLQAGESGFDLGAGAVQFSGIPTGMQNVLRDLQESPLGQEGEPARVDDHRDGRDAVRLHLRDPGPPGRHQGAARAAADPGAQGRDARRRVLRAQDASVARAGQRARRGGAGLVAGDGQRRSAVPQARRDRPPDPQRLHRQPRAVRGAARRSRGLPRRRGEGGRSQHRDQRRGDQPPRPARDRRRSVARRDREADRAVPGAEFPRGVPAPALVRRAGARLPPGRRGERRVGRRGWPRSRTWSGACSRRRPRRTAGTWSRCCRRC